MSQALTIAVQDRIARITLTRPEVRNAFNDEVIQELKAAFESVGARDDVRAVVLAAVGPAFCAGANLNWMRRMADYTRDENIADAGKLAEMLRTIAECPKPTIARVQGDVYAGGMGLVAACDMAVSVDTAWYCLSEVKIGLIPATISPYVIRAMGTRASHRYFLTAERFTAAEAHRIGFVHEVVARDALDAKVNELAQALVSASPAAVKACKHAAGRVAERPIDDALIAKPRCKALPRYAPANEGREGVQSFLQKRKPPGWWARLFLPSRRTPWTHSGPFVNWLHGLGLHAGSGVDTGAWAQVSCMPSLLALAAALGWASGFRLYLVVFIVGSRAGLGWIPLPEGLQVLQHPALLAASGFAAVRGVLCRQDPGPGLAVGHGATASSASRPVLRWPPACLAPTRGTMAMVGALLGGSLAATAQAAKTTTRAAINTSPEPFTNVGHESLSKTRLVHRHRCGWPRTTR
jgi:methylglutaconyl-CoA hydratase